MEPRELGGVERMILALDRIATVNFTTIARADPEARVSMILERFRGQVSIKTHPKNTSKTRYRTFL